MTIPTAVKIGGAALTAGGVPVASFAVYDSFFSLYKQEKDVLEATSDLSVGEHTPSPEDNDQKHTYLKISHGNNWECIVKAVATEDTPSAKDSKSDLINEIQEALPKSSDSSSSDVEKAAKQRNKKNLVKNCSKNRKPKNEQSGEKITSEIEVSLKKKTNDTTKWTFGENIGQLFGRGFWI